MKYYLRSVIAQQQTNQLSAPYLDAGFSNNQRKTKNRTKRSRKIKKSQKTHRNNSKILTTRRKRSLIGIQTDQQAIYHQKILRFPLKYKNKTLRVFCYNQSDLGFQKRFLRCYMKHQKDDDQQSGDSLIQSEIQRCKNDLFKSFRKYSESKQEGKSMDKSIKSKQNQVYEQKQSSKSRNRQMNKKCKRRISKRLKNKRH